MKFRNNDRTSNHPIGRNDGVSGRQLIYYLVPTPYRDDAEVLLRRKPDVAWLEGKILAQRRYGRLDNTPGNSRITFIYT